MKNFKKLSALVLTCCLMAALCLPVFAEIVSSGSTVPIDEEYGWNYDADSGELSHGDWVYSEYFMPSGYWVISQYLYSYEDGIRLDAYDNYDLLIEQILPDPEIPEVSNDIVFISSSNFPKDSDRVFVTRDGKALLDSFVAGEYATYQFTKGSHYRVDIAEQYQKDLSDMTPSMTLDVRTLRSAKEYPIVGIDKSGNFAHVIGAVYGTVDGNGYVYVDYDSLPDNYLDADGTLSFRGGEVPAYPLNASVVGELVYELENYGTSHYTTIITAYTFEQQENDMEQTPALILFSVMLIPFLFIAPLLTLILGVVLSLIKKIPGRKRWSALILTSGLWLLCSVAITVLCIVAIVM